MQIILSASTRLSSTRSFAIAFNAGSSPRRACVCVYESVCVCVCVCVCGEREYLHALFRALDALIFEARADVRHMFVLLGDISSVDEVRLEVLKLLYVDLVQGLFESMVFLQHNLCVDDVGSRARAGFAQYTLMPRKDRLRFCVDKLNRQDGQGKLVVKACAWVYHPGRVVCGGSELALVPS